METVIIVIHLMIVIAMVGAVLLQRSEGGALGIGGGGGGFMSGRGAANALTRTTGILAAAFFATSIALSLIAQNRSAPTSIFDGVQSGQPAAPGEGGQPGQGGGVLDALKRQQQPAPAQPSGPQVPQSQ